MPTRIISGKNAVADNTALLSKFGKSVLIVTSPSSRKNGALDDVLHALDQQGIKNHIVDNVRPNPSVASFTGAHEIIKKAGADFIIGIGGGSPLDAAKAYAVLGANDMPPMRLFDNAWLKSPLPIVAIPTTAGTGSEVTPYSILTIEEETMKRSFAGPDIFPKLCFLDAAYTATLPRSVCVDTAVDFLTHAVEGYLCTGASPLSDALAVEAMSVFAAELPNIERGDLSCDSRQRLLYASSVAGMVISQTRTIGLHAMGYALTTVRDIPHGRANGLLLAEFLKVMQPGCRDKIKTVLGLLGMKGIDGVANMIKRLFDDKNVFTADEIERFTVLTAANSAARPNPVALSRGDVRDIFAKSLL